MKKIVLVIILLITFYNFTALFILSSVKSSKFTSIAIIEIVGGIYSLFIIAPNTLDSFSNHNIKKLILVLLLEWMANFGSFLYLLFLT